MIEFLIRFIPKPHILGIFSPAHRANQHLTLSHLFLTLPLLHTYSIEGTSLPLHPHTWIKFLTTFSSTPLYFTAFVRNSNVRFVVGASYAEEEAEED